MTPEQQTIFCQYASMGIALGLEHRYEWLSAAIRSLQHGPYEEIQSRTEEIDEAFLAFEKTTASSPEEQEELDALTVDGLYHLVAQWYASPTEG